MPHQPLRLPACVPIAPIAARGPSSEGMTHAGRRYRHNACTSVQPRERRINRWQIASPACGSSWGLSRCGERRAWLSAGAWAVSSTTSVQGVENLIVATTDDEGLCSNHRSGVLPTSLRLMSEAPAASQCQGRRCRELQAIQPAFVTLRHNVGFHVPRCRFAADHKTAKSCCCGLDRRRQGGRLGRVHHCKDRHRRLLLRRLARATASACSTAAAPAAATFTSSWDATSASSTSSASAAAAAASCAACLPVCLSISKYACCRSGVDGGSQGNEGPEGLLHQMGQQRP